MLSGFLQQHPGLTIAIAGALLMLNARFDYAVGFLKPVAVVSWLVGGVLAGVALFSWIWGWWLFLGLLRYPVAVITAAASMYALVRFRPTNHDGGNRD